MHKVIKFLLATLLVWQGVAFAQTSTAVKPTPTFTPSASTSTSTTVTRKPANTGEIYRWIDKNGKVQYSADVPEDRRSTAKKVDTRSNIVSSQVPASISPAQSSSPPATSNTSPVAAQPITEREKCEAQWQRYNESVACFAQYRQGINAGRKGTNISEQAQAQCQNITEPAPCR